MHRPHSSLILSCLLLTECGATQRPETTQGTTAARHEEACHDVSELLALPVDLEVTLVAVFERCDGETRDFVVSLDHHDVGRVRVPCADVVGVFQAPPPSFRMEAVPISAGDHELEVRDAMTGLSEFTPITTPALLVSSDGRSVFSGAAVRIWASENELQILPPAAFRRPML